MGGVESEREVSEAGQAEMSVKRGNWQVQR